MLLALEAKLFRPCNCPDYLIRPNNLVVKTLKVNVLFSRNLPFVQRQVQQVIPLSLTDRAEAAHMPVG